MATNYLPITVVAAIFLFLMKEFFETFRRSRARAQKNVAISNLLSIEIEINNFVIRTYRFILNEMKDDIDSKSDMQFRIKTFSTGAVSVVRHKTINKSSSSRLREVRSEILTKVMLDASEIDPKIFVLLENVIRASAQLRHVRDSLIEHVNGETQPGLLRPFIDYGLDELDTAFEAYSKLYLRCSGRPLKSFRVR